MTTWKIVCDPTCSVGLVLDRDLGQETVEVASLERENVPSIIGKFALVVMQFVCSQLLPYSETEVSYHLQGLTQQIRSSMNRSTGVLLRHLSECLKKAILLMAKMHIHSDVLFPISVPVAENVHVSTAVNSNFFVFLKKSVLLWKIFSGDF